MTSDEERKDFAKQRNGGPVSDYAQRAALALEYLVPGPHRDKAIARIFECSIRLAQYLRRGQHWTIERLNTASQRIEGFDAAIANPTLARAEQLLREIEDIRDRIRGEIDAR